jgi:membrane protein YdbS with pleckstrin-like domain
MPKKKTRQEDSTVKIYQLYYKDSQRNAILPPAIALDCRQLPISEDLADLLRENISMLYLWQNRQDLFAEYTGILSWRFAEKMRISAQDAAAWIRQNPGYDVYLFNPFPFIPYEFPNVAEEGEIKHEGFIRAAEQLLKSIDFPLEYLYMPFIPNLTVYCNYWVANPKFWSYQMGFLEEVLKVLQDGVMDKQLFTEETSYESPAPMLPFILERVFFLNLWRNRKRFRVLSYHSPEWELAIARERICYLRTEEIRGYRAQLQAIDNLRGPKLIKFFVFRLLVPKANWRSKIRTMKAKLARRLREGRSK